MRAVGPAFVSLLLVCAVGTARAADFSLDDVTMVSSLATYRAKRVEVTGATLSREDALKLLAADNPDSAADRLARVDASRISIPELVSETKGAGVSQTMTYRNVVLDRVAHGRAEAVAVDEIVVDSISGPTASKGRMGAMRAEGVDFPAMTRMAMQARRDADEPKRPTTASFTMAGMEIETGDHGRLVVGRMSGSNFAGRALAAPMSSLVDLAPKPDAGPPNPETGRALALMFSDLLASVDIGALEMNDLTVSKPADDKGQAAAIRIRRVALAGMADGRLSNFSLEGVDNLVPEQAFKLDRLAIAGLDLRPLLKAAANASGAGAAAPATPQFDRIDLDGLSFNTSSEPVAARHVSIGARDWTGIAPGAVTARVENAVVSLKGAGAARSPALAALGYDRLDVTSGVDASLDPAKGELNVNELSANDPNVGGARLSAMFNHVSSELTSGDPERAKIALATMVFWRADLHLENHGALDRFVAAQAKQTGKSVAAIRDEMAAGARAMARSVLGAGQKNAQADRVADAAAKFVRGAKALDIRVFAPDGLGAVDLIMGAQLGALGDRLKIEADAH